MRNMSFMLTIDRIRQQTKTVTRRKGWRFLRPGDLVQPVEKCQGLKRGEKVKKIGGPIRVTSVWRESLGWITPGDVVKEGFPGLSVGLFVGMYCRANGGDPWQEVTRIEFEYVEKQT